ncbi:hypothetical protein NKDENANG_02727 [Candidatus Entotheonellaceae bacterium PAL068K]
MPDHKNIKPAESTRHAGRLERGVLWGGFGLALVAVVIVGLVSLQGGASQRALEAELQPYGLVPDFTLIERSGRQVSKADLLGKVWVVNFMFTRCVDTCPLESRHMARLQEAFVDEPDARWVSITVDPDYDTPAALIRYAATFAAHPQRWLFLTGDKQVIYRLARQGLHLGVVPPAKAHQTSAVPAHAGAWQAVRVMLRALQPQRAWAHHGTQQPGKTVTAIQHSSRFVLVDRQGRIRGYYKSQEEEDMRRLQRHVTFLLRNNTEYP